MSTVYNLEQQKRDFQTAIENRKIATRLVNNRDFKKLILEEFCVQECARYAQTSADPNLDAASRADALALAQAAGHLRRYLNVVDRMGYHAETSMAELELELTEARAEESRLDIDIDEEEEA